MDLLGQFFFNRGPDQLKLSRTLLRLPGKISDVGTPFFLIHHFFLSLSHPSFYISEMELLWCRWLEFESQ
jgi:hypothetical protein